MNDTIGRGELHKNDLFVTLAFICTVKGMEKHSNVAQNIDKIVFMSRGTLESRFQ